MANGSVSSGVGAVVLVCAIGGIVWSFRSAIRKSGNKTAKTLLRVSDTIVLFRFLKGLFFFGIFLVILVVAGRASKDGFAPRGHQARKTSYATV